MSAPGLHRHDRGAADAVALEAMASISSSSVSTSPSNPSFWRSRPVRICGESVAGTSVPGERGDGDVGRHQPVEALPDGGGERLELRQHLGLALPHHRQRAVAVGVGVAVPGEVLGDGDDVRVLLPAHELDPEPGHVLGSSPKERMPMTGLWGFKLTSSTGARFMLKPSSFRSSAWARPAS